MHRLVASVQVEDNGPGVPPQLRSSIFYPLVTGRANGTGLGLAVAQELVTRNGGIIEFDSEVGAHRVHAAVAPGRRDMNAALRVWLVDDDASIRWVLERALRNDGMAPRAFEAAEPALDALRRESPDVLITDIRMPGASGLELLRRIRDARPALPVIVMTAHSDLGSAVSAYEGGAFEYLPKPFDIDQAVALVRRAASGALARRQRRGAGTPRIPELLGRAPAMQQVFRAIGRLARSSVTVLITGESGTGKELVARALHEHSPRAAQAVRRAQHRGDPRGPARVGALRPRARRLHRRGFAQRRGRFEQADGGTLFLDEIGDMSMPLQTRLLRVLAEGEFYRVGGQTPIRVDVRVIAATHQNLQERVARGTIPRGSVSPPERDPHRAAAAARARPRTSRTCCGHYMRVAAQELGVEPKALAAGGARRGSPRTTGRATCASW